MGVLSTIGQRNRLIRIEQVSTTPDPDYGSPVETWTQYAAVWVNWQEELPSNPKQSEGLVGGVRVARRRVRVRMPFLRGLTSDMRVKASWGAAPWGSRQWWEDSQVYKIVGGPTELGNRQGIEMMVELFSSDGQGA